MTPPDGLRALPPLAETIIGHAGARAGAPAFRFMDRGGGVKREISWGELHREASRAAAELSRRGFAGRRVAIICPDPADFVLALAGCLLSGAVAVPVPAVATRRSAERIGAIIRTASPAAVVGTAATLAEPWIAGALGNAAALPLDELAGGGSSEAPPIVSDHAAPALVQFTSGSTAMPRGVVLSQGNLAANCAAIAEAYELDAASVGFSWLPLHHDMGLVGHVLTTFFVGGCSAIMNPLYFLQSPLRWLQQAGAQRATITSAPNFAYALCADAAERDGTSGLDLSTLTAAVCGGEPVSSDTMSRFCEIFAGCGFRRSAFAPSYGLAEATLLVASGRRSPGPAVHRRCEAGAPPVVTLGKAVRGCAIRIVDERGDQCREGEIGEIEVSGLSVGAMIDAAGGPGGVVRTGDLGYLVDGELHVSGRRKELIILRGQNVFPSDIETAALAADRTLRAGGVAAVGVSEGGTQALVVLVEVDQKRSRDIDLAGLCRAVNQAVTRASGFTPRSVLPVAAGTLPRTSSGKLQRTLIAEMVAAGSLKPLLVPEGQEA